MKRTPIEPVTMRGWKKGMDTRPGLFSDDILSLRELFNCVVTADGTIASRPPMRDVGGLLDSDCQGLIYNGGRFYTIARQGTTVTHSGAVASLVTTLYFDPPDYGTGVAWELLASTVFNGVVVAVIRHSYASTTSPTLTLLHVFDDRVREPTYVMDPAVPVSWTPSYPLWAYGTGSRDKGQFKAFTPVLCANSEKLWMTRADGNLAFSGIARPRIWNSRSPDDIEKTGNMYYFIAPTGSSVSGATFHIPDILGDLADIEKFAGYVVEVAQNDGSWTKLVAPNVTIGGGSKPWSNTAVAFNLAGVPDGSLLRIRTNVVPEVSIVAGITLSPASEYYTGDGIQYQFPSVQSFYAFSGVVKVNGNTKAASTYYTLVNNAGQARVDFASYSATITPGVNASTEIIPVLDGGGTGYAVGNVLTLVGGTFTTAATVTVATEAGGVITGITISNPGEYFVLPAQPCAVTGGAGTGATFTSTFDATADVRYVNTTMDYTAAMDTDFTSGSVGATLYRNGIEMSGSDYAVINNGGLARIEFTPEDSFQGDALDFRLAPADGRKIIFDRSGVLVSAGQIMYEQAIYTLPQFDTPTLDPDSEYYVFAGVTTAEAPEVVAKLTTGDDTLDGEFRYRHLAVAKITTNGAGLVETSLPFQYAREAQTQWYVARHQLNLDYTSGEGEAAFINTSSHDTSGSTITTMLAVKNRMMVCYPQSTQLWQTDPDPVNILYIDKYEFGTSDPSVLFYNRPVINTQRGIRAFDLTGLNFQSLDDTNIGEALQYFGVIGIQAPAFWPWVGGYVGFGSITGADKYGARVKLPLESPLRANGATQYGFYILSFSKESGTLAWSWNPIAGVNDVKFGTMLPVENRMYFVTNYTGSGNSICYLDAEDKTSFKDVSDANPIYSRITSHYNHLQTPTQLKRFISANVSVVGSIQVAGNMHPWVDPIDIRQGPVVTGTTYGMPRIPFTGTGEALTIELSCNTLAGFELQQLQIEYIELGRT